MSDPKADTIPAPPELKESALAHISERMLAVIEELRNMALDLGAYGATVDRHESELVALRSRVRELEHRLGTGEFSTYGGAP